MEVAEIYTQFYQSLLAFVKSKIRSNEDAQDVLQNVFIKISSNVNNLSQEEKLKNWIFTITRNTIIDYYRQRIKRKVRLWRERRIFGLAYLTQPRLIICLQ